MYGNPEYAMAESPLLPQEERRESLPIIVIPAGIFIIAACSVAYLPGWNLIVKGLGAILAFVFSIVALRMQLRISAELILYLCWALWSLLSMFMGKTFQHLFWEAWFSLVQTCFLILIISVSVSSRRILSFNLFCFLVAIVIVGGYSLFTGEYARAEKLGKPVLGLAQNANAFGFFMFLATVCMAYFWMVGNRARRFSRLVLLAGMILAALAVVASGSRKAFLALIVFYGLWLFFCYRRELREKPALILLTLFSVGLGVGIVGVAIQGTLAAKKLDETWRLITGESTVGGGSERFKLMREGFAAFKKDPLLGVGVGQMFIYSRSYHMSHSEYMETLAGTGIPGFLLYNSIIIVLWFRAGRIIRYSDDPSAVKICQLIRVLLILIAILNFGRTNYVVKEYWVVIASFIGYTHAIWYDLKSRIPSLARAGQAEIPAQGTVVYR